MMEEIWKDIKGYEGIYQISNNGKVKSFTRMIPYKKDRAIRYGKVLKTFINSHGYEIIKLSKCDKSNHFSIHRLMCLSFIPNPHNKHDINHIDGNKLNNNLDNLEWATRSENEIHAFKIGLKKATCLGMLGSAHWCSKHVSQYSLEGNLIAEYGSGKEASRVTGIHQANISRACLKKLKQTHGFIWRYAI